MIINIISRIILFFIGWSQFSDKTYKQFTKNKLNIIMYQHTSYIDLYIMMLYYLSYPNSNNKIKILLYNTPINFQYVYIISILCYIGIIPYISFINKSDDVIFNELLNDITTNQNSKCSILIPFNFYKEYPDIYGKLTKKCEFYTMSAGLDYDKHILKVSTEIPSKIDNEFVDKFLTHYISKIIPLNPHYQLSDTKKFTSKIKSYNLYRLFILFILILMVLFIIYT